MASATTRPLIGGEPVLVSNEPISVSRCITPWNLPAAMITRKLASGLAAGCARVLEPAAGAPLLAAGGGRR